MLEKSIPFSGEDWRKQLTIHCSAAQVLIISQVGTFCSDWDGIVISVSALPSSIDKTIIFLHEWYDYFCMCSWGKNSFNLVSRWWEFHLEFLSTNLTISLNLISIHYYFFLIKQKPFDSDQLVLLKSHFSPASHDFTQHHFPCW